MATGGPKSWRGRGARAAEKASAGAGSRRMLGRWTRKADAGYEKARRRYRLQIAAWSLLLAALVSAFLIYIFLRERQPALVIAAVSNYTGVVPPNAWVQEDCNRLLGLKAEDRRIVTCSDDILDFNSVVWKSLDDGLRQLADRVSAARPGGPDKNVVIVYLSMHGLVDGRGRPCLLPPGASREDSAQWLPVADLLGHIFPEGSDLRSDKVKKLLILDCGQIDVDWRLGVLYNDFAARLEAVRRQSGVPALVILTAAGSGQRAWGAPELGGSVFNFFLCKGLCGEADGAQSGQTDGEVSLGELYGYVAGEVERWVRERRDDVQVPGLLPADEDFPLVHVPDDAPELKPAPTYGPWEDLGPLWQQHLALAETKPWRLDPTGWDRYEFMLLRLERLAAAGGAYRSEFSDVLQQAGLAHNRLKQAQQRAPLGVCSLPMARRWRPWQPEPNLPAPWNWPPADTGPAEGGAAVPAAPPSGGDGSPATSGASEGAPDKPAAPSASTTSEAGAGEAPAAGQPAAAGEAAPAAPTAPTAPAAPSGPPPPYGYYAAAEASWEWFAENPSRDDMLDAVLGFVDKADRPPQVDLVEVHVMRMLRRWLDWEAIGRLRGELQWQGADDPLRSVLVTRRLAEQAAAASDPRAGYWGRGLVDSADERRRLAEDRLLVGSREALEADADTPSVKAIWTELQADDGPYRTAIALERRVADAYAVRDDAWARGAYLAQWALDPLRRGAAKPDPRLDELIEGVSSLAGRLEERLAAGQWSAEDEAMATELDDQLDALQAAYDGQCATTGDDNTALRRIISVLDVPLLSGTDRNELRQRYLGILQRYTAAPGPAGAGGGAGGPKRAPDKTSSAGAPAADQQAAGYLARLAAWPVHPALALLRTGAADADLPGAAGAGGTDSAAAGAAGGPSATETPEQLAFRLAQQGGEIRRLLKGVKADAEGQLRANAELIQADAAAAPQPGQPRTSAEVRKGRSRADRLVRAASPLLAEQPWPAATARPARLLGDLDLHYLLCWQAERALKDFWGPAAEGRQPYFEAAAGQYLEAARSLCPGGRQVDLLAGRLQAAADQGVRPAVDSKTPFADKDDPAIPLGFSVTAAADLPAGVAALYVEDSEGLLPVRRADDNTEIRRTGVPVNRPGAPPPSPIAIPNDQRLLRASQWRLTCLYRGHRWPDSFYPSSAGGLDIAYQPPAYSPPTITVYGPAARPAPVIFVLDCSASMNDPLTGAAGRASTRLSEACAALSSIFASLAQSQEPYEVGLYFYSRRVGFNPGPPSGPPAAVAYVSRDGRGNLIPRLPGLEDVFPTNDVEKVFPKTGDGRPAPPVGPLGQDEANALAEKLGSLRGLGATPLYLATIRAIEDLASQAGRRDRAAEQRVVVVTDGVNDQRGAAADVTTVEQLKTALQQHPRVRVDIIGLNIQPRNQFEREGLAEIRELERTSRQVTWYDLQDVNQLLQKLKDSLGLSYYEVVRQRDGWKAPPGQMLLNTTCKSIPLPERPERYVVRLVDPRSPAPSEVVLAGGEVIEMEVRDDAVRGRRLVHRRYDYPLRDSAKDVPAPGDPEGRRFFIGAHMAYRDPKTPGDVWFTVSVQNNDPDLFSPRPAEAWVEIRPVPPPPEDSGKPQRYCFYDVGYQTPQHHPFDRMVPVMKLRAPRWPDGSEDAEIRVWCKLGETIADRDLSVRDVLLQKPRLAEAPQSVFELKVEPRKTAGEPLLAVVTQRYPTGGKAEDVKAAMLPTPDWLVHRFTPKAGTVRSTFAYRDATEQNVENFHVRLTSLSRLADGSIHTPDDQPLRVPVPRQ